DAQLEVRAFSRLELEHAPEARLRAFLRRIHGVAPAADHALVERVLDEMRRARRSPQPLGVRLVVREQRLGVALDREPQAAERQMIGADRARAGQPKAGLLRIVLAAAAPRPGVAEPQLRKHVNARPLLSTIRDRDANSE